MIKGLGISSYCTLPSRLDSDCLEYSVPGATAFRLVYRTMASASRFPLLESERKEGIYFLYVTSQLRAWHYADINNISCSGVLDGKFLLVSRLAIYLAAFAHPPSSTLYPPLLFIFALLFRPLLSAPHSVAQLICCPSVAQSILCQNVTGRLSALWHCCRRC
jgi:hypothetical protein